MKKFFKEFKTFINKGSVMDLAVGMIIGSAFTAIVTALVNGILKPLINWIPLSQSGTGLQTVLRPEVVDADGKVLITALVLDWGGVISAIITFFLTALVLFLIVKSFNKLKTAGIDAKEKIEELAKKAKESLSDDKDNKVKAEEAQTVTAEAAPVEEEKAPELQEKELLALILEELKKQNAGKEEIADEEEAKNEDENKD